MNIKITGKELKAADAIKNYFDKKAERIEKYFDTEDINLFVTIKKEGKKKNKNKRRRRPSCRNANIC